MSKDKDTEIKSKYDDYSVEELKAALNAIFDSSDEFSDSQVEEMDKIMAVLTKKNPLPQRYTAEESWKIFQETYSEELSHIGIRNTEEVMEQEPEATTVKLPEAVMVKTSEEAAPVQKRGFRKLLHTALIAAAVIAAMVIITVSAAAAGINIWKWVPIWNDSTFRYAPEDTVSSTTIDIPTALKQLGIRDSMFPTWLPEGYVLDELQIHMEDPILIHVTYLYRDRAIMTTIRSIDSSAQSIVFEKDDNESFVYSSNHVDHFLCKNIDQYVATWQSGNYYVKLSGDISLEELKKMIDSIYEDKE